MVFDNHPAEVETNSGSRLHSRTFIVGSEKRSEYMSQVFSVDPDALILDPYYNFIFVLQLDNRFDLSISRRL